MSRNYRDYMYDAQGSIVESIDGTVEDKSGNGDGDYTSYNLNDDRAMSTPAPFSKGGAKGVGMRVMTPSSLPGVEGFKNRSHETKEDDEEEEETPLPKQCGGTCKLLNCGNCSYNPNFMNGYMQCHDCKFKINGQQVDKLFANGVYMNDCVKKNSHIYLKNTGSDITPQLRLTCD